MANDLLMSILSGREQIIEGLNENLSSGPGNIHFGKLNNPPRPPRPPRPTNPKAELPHLPFLLDICAHLCLFLFLCLLALNVFFEIFLDLHFLLSRSTLCFNNLICFFLSWATKRSGRLYLLPLFNRLSCRYSPLLLDPALWRLPPICTV